MTTQTNSSTQPEAPRRRLEIERTFRATLDDVWDLWTTKEGIESWWGPDGFTVNVRRLDLRAGGILDYAMTATGPPQIEFMKRAGMPLTTESQITYTEVAPRQRLAYQLLADFVPGVEPYSVSTLVSFESSAEGVKLALSFDAMHDAQWTQMAVAGRESELDKLAKALESHMSKTKG
jgi:uncharacterized protein YndB with AHSA1/START domain